MAADAEPGLGLRRERVALVAEGRVLVPVHVAAGQHAPPIDSAQHFSRGLWVQDDHALVLEPVLPLVDRGLPEEVLLVLGDVAPLELLVHLFAPHALCHHCGLHGL
eukprot:3699923-Lingulodinium_polyedra.AAC.1